MIWIFPRRFGRADSVHHSSKRSFFHGCLVGLRRLKKHAHSSPRELGSGLRGSETCATHACVLQMALPLGCVCWKCPDAARLHHQRAEKTWKQNVDWLWTPNSNTKKSAAPKPLGDTKHASTPSLTDRNLRTRASPRKPEDTQKRNAGWLISFLSLLSQDAARLWMCVWPLQRGSS